jgi:hypothetical protein
MVNIFGAIFFAPFNAQHIDSLHIASAQVVVNR